MALQFRIYKKFRLEFDEMLNFAYIAACADIDLNNTANVDTDDNGTFSGDFITFRPEQNGRHFAGNP